MEEMTKSNRIHGVQYYLDNWMGDECIQEYIEKYNITENEFEKGLIEALKIQSSRIFDIGARDLLRYIDFLKERKEVMEKPKIKKMIISIILKALDFQINYTEEIRKNNGCWPIDINDVKKIANAINFTLL